MIRIKKVGLRPHPTELEWQDEAACLDTDPSLFFAREISDSEKNLPGRYTYCLPSADNNDTECPVRLQCLEYALRNRESYGIWGGMTTLERKRLVKARANGNG